MGENSVFTRESSGLIKDVNGIDAVMLNLGNMSAGVALYISISPFIPQGGIIWIAAIIGLILTLPQAYIYSYLSGKIARTGGDYVWISRTFNGFLGTTMAFALMIESTAYFALIAFFFSQAIGSVLSTIGRMDGITSLVSISNTLSAPVYSYLLGAMIFGIAIGFNILKAKWGYALVTVSGLIAMAATIIAMVVLAMNLGDFHTAISKFISVEGITPPSNYASSVAPFSLVATIGILPIIAIFTYPWMQATPAVAAEVKKVKFVKYGVFVPLLITGALVTLGFFLMYQAGGYAFTNYEFINNGFTYTFWTVAIGLTNNLPLQLFMGIGLLMWEFSILAYGVVVFARYIFAMAFDRVFPEIFTRLNKGGSPVYTHAFDLALTLGLLVFPVVSISGATSLYGAIVIGMVYFMVVSIAALLYGSKNKAPALIVASVIEIAYFLFLTYEAVTNPTFSFVNSNGTPNPITLAFVILSFVIGALIFLASKFYNKKRGVDIDLAYKEIPPE
ncbi:APC family permease [Sulfuracidifex metallicus DSM 6482 = JCM 9184]|nr:APC family permease [Sulfuracidifex metallicus DSM 6482 = JCM 9184]